MCCCHYSLFYRALPYFHAFILFIEFILGIVRIVVFFSEPSSGQSSGSSTRTATDSRAVAGFIIDWISSFAATLMGLVIALTLIIVVVGFLLTCLSSSKNKVRSQDSADVAVLTFAGLKRIWTSKRLHRFIQLNCNCPWYKTRPQMRFIVRLIYLGLCFLFRIIAISLYASASNTSGGGTLAAVCAISLACLTLILPLDLYHYCVWWHYRPSCDTKCSMVSKKHRRYIPYHLMGDNRTMRLGDKPCLDGHSCSNRTLEHIMIFHLSDHKPQARFFDLPQTTPGKARYIGFHQTSPDAAVSIAHSDFRISDTYKGTMLGHGVYFARSIDGTQRKANNGGAYICAEIEMGRVKRVGEEAYQSVYRGKNDWWSEYDTMYLCHTDDARDEFCVKSPDQVLHWIMIVDEGADTKVESYGLKREFEETWCGFV